ncbi:MAG TPA: TrkA family potassium uptake protein [Dissulfurispiraceae bacterium]|nr:TrkA family potassium uptake protein [Dissulfurispiraceae bacterium]
MKKQYAVIGLGRFGYSVAKTLTEMDCEVIAIDNDEEKVKTLADLVTYAVVLDAMDDKALRSVGVQNVDGAIVSIGENIEASILVVMILKDLGVKHIVAKAVTQLHGRVLENLKVDRIVYPERDMAIRIAQSLIRPSIVEQLELSADYSIVELPAPGMLIGKTLRESQLRRSHGVSVIAIRRTEEEKGVDKERWILNPLATDAISAGDLLVLIGKNEDLEKFSRL